MGSKAQVKVRGFSIHPDEKRAQLYWMDFVFWSTTFSSLFVSAQYADQAREDYEHGKVVRGLSTRGMGITRTDDLRLVSSGSGLHRR